MTNDQARGLASLRRLAITTQILLGIYAVLCLLNVLYGLLVLNIEVRAGFGYAYALALSPLTLLGLVVFVVALVPALWWLYRARRNLEVFGLSELLYSPGGVIACCLIPLVNFVVPRRAMVELYNRSHGEDSYQAMLPVPSISTWWTLFIAGSLLMTLLEFEALLDILTNFVWLVPLGTNTAMGIIAVSMLGASAVMLIRLIGRITKAQASLTGISDTFA